MFLFFVKFHSFTTYFLKAVNILHLLGERFTKTSTEHKKNPFTNPVMYDIIRSRDDSIHILTNTKEADIMNVQNNALIRGRRLDFFHHKSEAEWGYEKEQQNTFAVMYPKDYDETKKYPLYVVFHSAGHDIYSTFSCIGNDGDHDIYHTPDDMFGLVLDCRTNKNDWWWGGINILEPSRFAHCMGTDLQPVENRCIATVKWTIDNFPIDDDRVYGVGNSMGGSGVLGIGLRHGDVFAAIKANVPGGVRHAVQRLALESENPPEGIEIPDPPVAVDYSSQLDVWANEHEVFYDGMRRHRYAIHGYWGEFGHENNDEKIAAHNDLVHALPVFTIKKSDPYPVFTNATTDDVNPWEDKENGTSSGQINGFFRFEPVCDSAESLEIKLWLLRPTEWKTRAYLPVESVTDILLRRVKGFKLSAGEEFKWTFGDASGVSKADGAGRPSIDKLCVTQEPTILKLTK